MAKNERDDLFVHLARCRDLLVMMRDPAARKTIEDLIGYLESKLVAIDEKSCRDGLEHLRRLPLKSDGTDKSMLEKPPARFGAAEH